MPESITSFVSDNARLLWGLASLAMVVLALSQKSVRFWLRDLRVTFPLIGDIARLSRDPTNGNNGWRRSEEALCSIYKPNVVFISEDAFKQRIEYMRKATDLGRIPTPSWVWILLVILVTAEGLGFSYLLGSWMARDGSANTHTLLMFTIAFVLCVFMVALTHTAGHQYHRTHLLRSCFRTMKNVKSQEFISRIVALEHNQSDDDNLPAHVQCANRVVEGFNDRGSYAVGIFAIIAIIVIASVSTWMRWENLRSELTHESTGQNQGARVGNPFTIDGLLLPPNVIATQKAADDKAGDELKDSTMSEGIAAFIMLAFIFVITQIVSMGAGYKYGFVGKETLYSIKKVKMGAFKDTGGFPTYDAYWAHIEPIIDLANARLQDLQQRLECDTSPKLGLSKTFENYLLEQQEVSAKTRGKSNCVKQQRQHDYNSKPPAESKTELEEGSVNTSTIADSQPESATIPNLDSAKAHLVSLADKQAQQNYYCRLSPELKTKLKPWLKQRKEEETARQEAENKAQQAELEELF